MRNQPPLPRLIAIQIALVTALCLAESGVAIAQLSVCIRQFVVGNRDVKRPHTAQPQKIEIYEKRKNDYCDQHLCHITRSLTDSTYGIDDRVGGKNDERWRNRQAKASVYKEYDNAEHVACGKDVDKREVGASAPQQNTAKQSKRPKQPEPGQPQLAKPKTVPEELDIPGIGALGTGPKQIGAQ